MTERDSADEGDGAFATAVLAIAVVGFIGWVVKQRYFPEHTVRPVASVAMPSARPVVGKLHVAPITSAARSRPVEFRSDLGVEARAYAEIWPVLTRDRFELRTVRCWPEADYHLCALCSSGPRRELGATLVKCDKSRCYWPLDASEYERVGWSGEPECLVKEGEE